MALRGKQPTTIEKRLKALFYGEPGAGKTMAAIQCPRPYLIDTERGAEHSQYTKLLEQNGGVIFQTNDFHEVVEEVQALLTEKHNYKTLVIDPITVLYNNLLTESEIVVGNKFGRHYGEANKKMKQLINLVMRLDMNVIFTAHSKNEYGDEMKVIDQVADGYKKLPYLFDVQIEIKKEGKKRFGNVRKSRIAGLEEFSRFEFSYDEIANRYGRKALEKDSVQEKLATEDQIIEIRHLFLVLRIDSLVIHKCLTKGNSTKLEEMPHDLMQKWIDALKAKVVVNQ